MSKLSIASQLRGESSSKRRFLRLVLGDNYLYLLSETLFYDDLSELRLVVFYIG